MKDSEYAKLSKAIKEMKKYLKRDDGYRAMRSLENLESQIKNIFLVKDKN